MVYRSRSVLGNFGRHGLLALGVFCLMVTSDADAQTLGGASGPAGDPTKVERCDVPKGTLAVVEPQDAVLQALSRIGLQSPTGMIRLIVQQSNCFQIVERGAAFQNLMQERTLASGGQLQAGQNVGQGQLVAADFVVTPSVVFSNPNAGGFGGGALAGLGGKLGVIGAIAGGLKFKEAQTSMTMADTRSGLQVAVAEGSAQKTDFNIGGALLGGAGGAALGGYNSTAEGKIVAASFLDNWNKIVRSVRDNPSLTQARAGTANLANASSSTKAGAGQPGDVYLPKIDGVKAYKTAAEGAVLITLKKTDGVIHSGEEQEGFIKVETSNGVGWVKAILMRKE